MATDFVPQCGIEIRGPEYKKRIVINMYQLPYIGRLGRLDDCFTLIKIMLREDGYTNSDTSRKLQQLSVRYFPK